MIERINGYDVLFVKSIRRLQDRPSRNLKEIAVAGRSNVGKSSLINTLLNRKKLAKISATPGKTRLINYFCVDNTFYLVDLPGYGFARRSKTEQREWQLMLESYLSANKHIVLVLLLIDSRRGLLEIDHTMIKWLNHLSIPFAVVLTKVDKLSQNELNSVRKTMLKEISVPSIVSFSAKSKQGREELLGLMAGYVKN